MINDGQEHICHGCFEIIAAHEPEAYQRGKFYYHSEAHEDMHVHRPRIIFVEGEAEQGNGWSSRGGRR